jgi:hypothetical protein
MEKEDSKTKPETSPNQQEDQEDRSIASVTSVTGSLSYGKKMKLYELNEQPVTPVTDRPSEPCFLWRRIPSAERCELCGQFAVEFEINHLAERQVLRRCEACFNKMRTEFGGAVWRHSGLEEAETDG